jgi:transposase
MEQVIIGVDPDKLSATVEVIDGHESLFGSGRFGTGRAGYAAMPKHVARWADRVWAVEGANGAGRPLAQRLLEAGEHVVDVPAKLAARARLFDTGHNRKTDAHDAHSVAVVAVRTQGCASWPMTPNSRRCGCSPTDARSSPGNGSRPSTGSNACCRS